MEDLLNSIEKKGRIKYHYEQRFNPPKPYSCLDLLQIGTSYFEPNTRVDLHTHVGFFELTAISSGSGIISANNLNLPVEAGDIFVSLPYDTHRIEAGDEGMNYNFFAFYLKDSDLLADMEKLSLSHTNPSDRVIRSERANSLLSSAIIETGKERPHQDKYLDAIFVQLIVQIIRTFDRRGNTEGAPGKSLELCYQIMDYINSHIFSLNSLSEELPRQFSYDYTYLSKIFTKTTSQSISEYYRFQRLEVGRALIHENSLKLSEIAEKLRYSSIYSFSKAFKKQYSLSPRAYKKLHVKEP